MVRNVTCDVIFTKLIVSIIILLTPVSLYAGNVTLTWDPPTTNVDGSDLTDLAGYKIHYGIESTNYTEIIDIGNVSEYPINNLTEGTTYYFVITAYDLSVPPNESVFSNELDIYISTTDTTSPVIAGVQSTDITSSSVNISWTTDEVSDTRIEYGFTTSYGNITTLDSSMVTSHMQSINGLQSSKLYHYRVISRDGSGNEAVSGDYMFTTAEQPPLIHYYCDSDNDGYVDISTDGSCSGNGCAPAGCQTTSGNDCDDNASNVNPGAADSDCNGIDNNCDGIPDNNYSPTNTSCGTGSCQATGQLICSNGAVTDTCTAGTPTAETCDNLDNDCDGAVDENLTQATTCGFGACSGNTGVKTCSAGAWINDTCDPLAGAAAGDSLCNNIDDDCDGGVDEDYVITSTTCGVGECAGNTGQFECQNGTEVNTCDPLAGALPEVCDGSLDENCDGTVDEGCGCVTGQTRPTTCGAGECGSTGIETCSGGVWGGDTCTPGTPSAETCDNLDNDCDGVVDENLTQSTTCGEGACAGNTGVKTCSAGAWINDTCDPLAGAAAGDSLCNNIDDDCDGGVDEDFVITATTCGTGVCQSTGQLVCQIGSEINTCVPNSPEENPETTCGDGLDNDCNGKVDEGCSSSIKAGSVLLDEDFSSGIPETWQVQGAWNTDNPCSRSIEYPFEGKYAIADSSCMTTEIEELEIGSIDTSSCDRIELDLTNQYYWYAGGIDVDISDDGGFTWTNTVRISADDGYPTPSRKKIDISSLAHAQDGRIKFKYSNNADDGFWALDNVSISCQSSEVEMISQIDMPASKTMMISNTGSADLGINAIEITGDDSMDFSIGVNDGCSYQTLLAGETCLFDIIFMPVSSGPRTATLSIWSDDPHTPVTNISLLGKASDVVDPLPEPEITIHDTVVPFHDLHVPFGDITEFTSSDQTITVKNDGNAELVIGDITQADQMSSPFSIFTDDCSWQNIAPSGSCSVTVRFSPDAVGLFSDVINIASNDSDKSMTAVALDGTGLSSSTNNPPSKPKPKSPGNRGKGHGRKVEFKWEESTDPDGDTVSYQLQICEDPNLTTGCIMGTNLLSETGRDTYYAGIGSFSVGLLFFGIVIIVPFKRVTCQKLNVFVAVVAVTGMLLLVSCGKLSDDSVTSSNSNSSQEVVSQVVSGLRSGTTYYWQVVAEDGKGGETYSDVWSFETATQQTIQLGSK
jgi:hypothetical protein